MISLSIVECSLRTVHCMSLHQGEDQDQGEPCSQGNLTKVLRLPAMRSKVPLSENDSEAIPWQ